MELTGTHLRYLLNMYQLSRANSEMRLTEIANALHVKKASVARIVGVFRQKELVEQQPYGKVHLTEHGRQIAEQYEHCVHNLAVCLTQTGLPLSEQEACDAACILLPELPEHCVHKIKHLKVVDN